MTTSYRFRGAGRGLIVGAALGLLVFASVWLLGCEADRAAEKTAIRFLEYTVFTRDFDRAASLAEGEALAKLEAERERVPFGIPDPGQGVRHPIGRELIERSVTEDGSIAFTFRVILRPKSGGAPSGTMTVRVGKKGSDWRVLDYTVKGLRYNPATEPRQRSMSE